MFTTECVEDLAAQLIVREKAAVDAEAVSAKLQASFDGLVAAERDLQHAIEASERFDSTDSVREASVVPSNVSCYCCSPGTTSELFASYSYHRFAAGLSSAHRLISCSGRRLRLLSASSPPSTRSRKASPPSQRLATPCSRGPGLSARAWRPRRPSLRSGRWPKPRTRLFRSVSRWRSPLQSPAEPARQSASSAVQQPSAATATTRLSRMCTSCRVHTGCCTCRPAGTHQLILWPYPLPAPPQLKQRLEGKEAKDRRSQAADSGAALRRVNELAQQAEDSGGCGLPGCSQDGPCGAAKCPATDGTAALSIATSNEAVLSAETELARVVPEQQQQQQQREAEEAAAAAAAGGKDAPLGALWSALSAAASSMLGGGAAPPPPPIDLEEALLAAPHRSPLAPSILSRVLKRTQEQAKVCAGLSKSLRQARAAVEADLTAAKTALSAEAREERKKQKQPPLAPEEETRLQLVVQAANALLSDADAILAAADAWAGGRRLDQKPPAVLARTSELRPVAAAAVAANKGFQDTAAAVRSHLPAARLLLACARVSEAVETRERRCEAARDAARERARRAVLRQLREEEEQQAFTDETERGGGCGALGCTAMRTGSACNKTRCVAFECFEARVALRDGCGPLLAGESRLHAFAHIYTR